MNESETTKAISLIVELVDKNPEIEGIQWPEDDIKAVNRYYGV